LYDATEPAEAEGGRPDDLRDPFPDDVLRLLMRRVVRYGAVLEPHDHGGVRASMSEIMALGELAAAPALSQQDLADLLGLEKSTVSRLVAGLESRGWVDRERDPANRRYTRLQLTDTGRQVARRIGAEFADHHRALLAALRPHEREALVIGLTAVARVLERHGRDTTGAPRRGDHSHGDHDARARGSARRPATGG
jgi:DNA-binding MarR family transcriptional regulator